MQEPCCCLPKNPNHRADASCFGWTCPAFMPPEIRVSVPIAVQARKPQTACVIDARGLASFAIKPDTPRTGHIAGAVNVPFSEMLGPDTKVFLDLDGIKTALDALAPKWDKQPLITSFGSGYAAIFVRLAFA